MHLADAYPKRLTVHSGFTFFFCQCVSCILLPHLHTWRGRRIYDSLHCIPTAINCRYMQHDWEREHHVQPYIWEAKCTESGTKQRNVTELVPHWPVFSENQRTKPPNRTIKRTAWTKLTGDNFNNICTQIRLNTKHYNDMTFIKESGVKRSEVWVRICSRKFSFVSLVSTGSIQLSIIS